MITTLKRSDQTHHEAPNQDRTPQLVTILWGAAVIVMLFKDGFILKNLTYGTHELVSFLSHKITQPENFQYFADQAISEQSSNWKDWVLAPFVFLYLGLMILEEGIFFICAFAAPILLALSIWPVWRKLAAV